MEKKDVIEAASRLINSDKVVDVYIPFCCGFDRTEYVAKIIDGEDSYIVRVTCETTGKLVTYYLTIESNSLKLFSGYAEAEDGKQLFSDIRKQFIVFDQKRKEEEQIKKQNLEVEREKRLNDILEKF